MKSFRSILILVAVLIIAWNLPSQAQTPEQLYQRGLMKEEGEGKLQDAINLYDQIADNSSADPSIRAKALLHIGMCYERMGTQEAVEAYQRLVNNFPTQENEVAIARERLKRLMPIAETIPKSPPIPKFTKIQIPTELSWSVRLSPDGKDLALVSEEKLWIMPLSSNIGPEFPGKPVHLDTDGIDLEWTGLSWSGDGKWIVFNEIPLEDRPENEKLNQSIFIVPATGGQPRKIIENYRDFSEKNYRISISPDGKKLAYSSVENNEQHIYTTQIDGGPQNQLVDIQAREPAFSPDGKWIAYVEDKALGYAGGNLYIVSATGGTPKLVAKSNKASSPIWSPDGSIIAFIDEESGNQIKFVRVQDDGNISGKVTSINVPEGIEKVMVLAGWAPDNKIGALLTTKQELSLYTLPAKGGQATKVLHDRLAIQPRWSPDGDQIIFITTKSGTLEEAPNFELASVPSKGGSGKLFTIKQDHDFVHLYPPQGGNRFSPDGKSIVFSGWTESDTAIGFMQPAARIWRLSADGHTVEKLTTEKGSFLDESPSWSPDGKKIAFIRYNVPESTGTSWKLARSSIYIINSTGGEPELLVSEEEKSILLSVWSPDGKMIAYLSREGEDKYNLNVINVDDGVVRVLCEIPKFISTLDPCWSPDSRQIAYNDGKVIRIVNLSDGTIEDIETNLKDEVNIIYYLDWSPDGEQFVFGGAIQGEDEFWFLENFLPLKSLQQKPEIMATEEPEGIRIKQVWETPHLVDLGTVSYDGLFRSCVDWKGSGDLAIHNLISGEIRPLTHKATMGDTTSFVLNTAISKNGKQIVSTWWKPYNTTDLMLFDVENSTSELLYSQEGEEVYPASWLSDDEIIAIRTIPDQRTMQIVSINIPNKTLHVKKSFKKIQNIQLACSPDEKYIAYHFSNDADKENLDIHLLLADGESDIPLITHPANDRVFGWVPGRKEFLFLSDRSGAWDLWAVTLDETKLAGPAKRIYADIGEVAPMGFTQNGNCYFGFVRRNFYTSIAPLNTETGEIILGAGKSMKGSNYGVTWSPDGQYLAYAQFEDGISFIIRDLKTGREHQPLNKRFAPLGHRWSLDGNSILFVGFDENQLQTKGYKGEIFLLDRETGQTEEILQLSDYEYNVPQDDAFPLSGLEWPPDGKSIYYLFFKDRLVHHDLETGMDKILYKHTDFTRDVLDLSPDGTNLLFGLEYPGDKKSRLFTMPAEGGEEKEVCTVQEAGKFNTAFWSPDGTYIYFVELLESKNTSLWRVPSKGGNPEKVWSSENRVDIFDIHPDGNQISFSIRERKTEVRAVENLGAELSKVFK